MQRLSIQQPKKFKWKVHERQKKNLKIAAKQSKSQLMWIACIELIYMP